MRGWLFIMVIMNDFRWMVMFGQVTRKLTRHIEGPQNRLHDPRRDAQLISVSDVFINENVGRSTQSAKCHIQSDDRVKAYMMRILPDGQLFRDCVHGHQHAAYGSLYRFEHSTMTLSSPRPGPKVSLNECRTVSDYPTA